MTEDEQIEDEVKKVNAKLAKEAKRNIRQAKRDQPPTTKIGKLWDGIKTIAWFTKEIIFHPKSKWPT